MPGARDSVHFDDLVDSKPAAGISQDSIPRLG